MSCSFSSRKTARRCGFQGLLNLHSLTHRFQGFAAYEQFNQQALIYTGAAFLLFMGAAIVGYNPSKGMMVKKGGGG
jgi:hypothetical protein